MHSIARRNFLQVSTALACTTALPSRGNCEAGLKAAFMKDAINDIKLTREKSLNFDACTPVPFADWDFYYTDGKIVWRPDADKTLPAVTVPPGFCCDLTSIPQFFWTFGLPKTGRYAYAAIVHDYLYWNQEIATREQADKILYAAMIDSGVAAITQEAINFAVSKLPYFAQSAWDSNTAAKKKGAKRILSVRPPSKKISWAEWSKDSSHFSD